MNLLKLTCRAVAQTALLGIALCFAAPSYAQKVFNLGGFDNPASDSGQALDAFAKAVEEMSEGSMKIDVSHRSQLGSGPEMLRNTKSGAQSMVVLFTSMLGAYPEAKVIGLPYVFRSLDHLQAFHKSPLWKPVNDTLEEEGAIILDDDWTWYRLDPRGFISTRPVFTPADMDGLKLRIWESAVVIETWRGFGANPIVVPRSEMYLAFKQKIIEGGPETIGTAYDQKNVEMAKYWTKTEEYYQLINLLMNKEQYDALSAEEQTILRDATKIGGEVFRKASLAGFEEKAQLAREEYGVNVIIPDLDPWREAGQKTLEKMMSKLPEGLIEKIQALQE